mmetsp:Transcript_5587/g.13493  ORF Transcript_5587/g.13493 Transcript_5587/m.13493 type:complete len:80 (-) Transcript_5587:524-763(-)
MSVERKYIFRGGCAGRRPRLNDFFFNDFICAFSSLQILFDTSLLINKLNPDQYIEAVISLYLDIINLFLQILQALTPRN